MKISASLLRPMVEVTADGDFCISPHLSAVIKVPPVEADVSKIPVAVAGKVGIPDVKIQTSEIPVHVSASGQVPITLHVPQITASVGIEFTVFGVTYYPHISTILDPFTAQANVGPIALSASGAVGGISATTHAEGPVDVDMNGTLGGFTAHAQMREPVTMAIDGCLKGLARLNPDNLQIPKCCEGYREPVCCSCHVHKDHGYCDKSCGCSHRE